MSTQQLAHLLDLTKALAEEAGRAVMSVYESDFTATEKGDRSPLTEADLASNRVIVAGLSRIDTSIPILSEESKEVPYDDRSGWTQFWLVDPLDGTKEFIKRNGEFTVNIALIDGGKPVLGVVHAPALDRTYAAAKGVGAWIHSPNDRAAMSAGDSVRKGPLRVVASRSHAGPSTETLIDKLRERYGDVELVSRGSSLKLCMVAEGAADFYPRLGPTMEWDTAAAQAVVEVAGGAVTDLQGNRLTYNKRDLLNPHFVVTGRLELQVSDFLAEV